MYIIQLEKKRPKTFVNYDKKQTIGGVEFPWQQNRLKLILFSRN